MLLDVKDVISFYITEHLMKFNAKKTYFESQTLIWSRFLLFFVNSLALYLHLTSTKDLKDLHELAD